MTTVATYLNGRIRVTERDTGYAVEIHAPGTLPSRIGLYPHRHRAIAAARALAGEIDPDA
jgi:hypothetical protein